MGLIKNGTKCVTKTTTHTSKKLRKWPNRDRTTPSSMALFGHYLAKNHPAKNAIEQKYSPRAHASSGHAPWHCPTDLPFHGFPPALLTIFYIMNRQQGSRSGWGGWHTQQSSSSMLPPDQGGSVRWWGGGVDLHVGMTYHPTRYHKKLSNLFWGGVLCSNQ
jgi:hypothetical protein